MEPMTGWSRAALLATVASGLFDVIAYIAYAIGLEIAPVWLVGLASSFGPVLAVGYAIRRLGERPHATQWAGLALIALGVVVLALSG
jgi:drug/metabolite transporter (DMT)-like permease